MDGSKDHNTCTPKQGLPVPPISQVISHVSPDNISYFPITHAKLMCFRIAYSTPPFCSLGPIAPRRQIQSSHHKPRMSHTTRYHEFSVPTKKRTAVDPTSHYSNTRQPAQKPMINGKSSTEHEDSRLRGLEMNSFLPGPYVLQLPGA